jgi:hypothetical protein
MRPQLLGDGVEMKCRKFKSSHVGFIDDVLSAADMADMRQHLAACPRCAMLDVRIRRSLMIVRNLPQIEPSADFFARLNLALQQAPAPAPRRQPLAAAATYAAVTAALAAAVYFAMAFTASPDAATTSSAMTTAAAEAAAAMPITEVSIAAAVPAGIPVWPAMFMVGELPAQITSAELLDNTFGR